MKRLLSRFGGFFTLPLLSMLTPFLLLPILSRVAGQAGWVSIGVGQALGAVAGTVILFGWWIVGPARYHEASSSRERLILFTESMQSRVIVSLIALPAVGLVSAVLAAPDWRLEAVLMSWAMGASGLSPSWYCIAAGSARLLALYDTLPKVGATVAAAFLLLLTAQVWTYPALLLLATLSATVAFSVRHAPFRRSNLLPAKALLAGIRTQLPVVTSNLVGTTYTATPLPIASAVSPISLSTQFASAERLYRLSKFSIVSLGNALQSWVLERNSGDRRRRNRIAFAAHGILGFVGGSMIFVLGPAFTSWLFGDDVGATFGACLGFGLSFAFLSCSTPLTRNVLIPAGQSRVALRATTTGAVVGVPLMLILFNIMGVTGIGLGLACSEAAVFFMLLPAAVQHYRQLDC